MFANGLSQRIELLGGAENFAACPGLQGMADREYDL
jgi:hypothetical protein